MAAASPRNLDFRRRILPRRQMDGHAAPAPPAPACRATRKPSPAPTPAAIGFGVEVAVRRPASAVGSASSVARPGPHRLPAECRVRPRQEIRGSRASIRSSCAGYCRYAGSSRPRPHLPQVRPHRGSIRIDRVTSPTAIHSRRSSVCPREMKHRAARRENAASSAGCPSKCAGALPASSDEFARQRDSDLERLPLRHHQGIRQRLDAHKRIPLDRRRRPEPAQQRIPARFAASPLPSPRQCRQREKSDTHTAADAGPPPPARSRTRDASPATCAIAAGHSSGE